MKFCIITLGCKVNQYESEALREAWLRTGHTDLPSPEGAELVLINSCAVTAKAVRDLRAHARRARRLSPACKLLVSGCATQALPEEMRGLPLDALIPQKNKADLLHILPQAEDTAPALAPEPERADGFPPFRVSGHARSRAVLKIHDGCSRHCAYCIVPLARGPSVSRPWPAVLAEADRLLRAGFREIILSGVNLGLYGADLSPPESLWTLFHRLESAFAVERDLRFRLSSLEPGQWDEAALERIGRSSLLAPHLHLSLQSGSQAVLRRMGRDPDGPGHLPDFLAALRKTWPIFGLGADFIVGFPGESEAEFADTLALASSLPLSYAHIFPYSPRPGTPAAHFKKHVPPEVKKDRAVRLRALIRSKKAAFLRQQIALPQVLVAPEGECPERGVNEFYSICRFNGSLPPAGRGLVPARPLYARGSELLVEAITNGSDRPSASQAGGVGPQPRIKD
ncbi:MAG: MiaB/RimO family radical SAM methylthiotransferase, partial [Deltaproteobacteria bacterium]|nr:MiaB/RimO family radical SAM methylthiotransferase [Deltaproteobacteria bacterium]